MLRSEVAAACRNYSFFDSFNSIIMKADLDFDIVIHLGFVRNVDLLNKGLYVVQVRLFYGLDGKIVSPVGMFSSPSSIASDVHGQAVSVIHD